MSITRNLGSIADGFSEPKKKLLYYLKVMHQAGLEDLAASHEDFKNGSPQASFIITTKGSGRSD